jgi:hypothetical protein
VFLMARINERGRNIMKLRAVRTAGDAHPMSASLQQRLD